MDCPDSRISSALQMNQCNSNIQAARQKIIKCHFSFSDFSIQPFVDMDLEVLPHVVAWMGRDGNNDDVPAYARYERISGRSLLYHFIKGMPRLFNFTHIKSV